MKAVNIKRIGAAMTIAGLCFSNAAFAGGNDEAPIAKAVAAETIGINLPIASLYTPEGKRPSMLTALYASLGAVQAWDLYSTSAALKAGAHEANPTVASFASNKGAMLGMKAATTAGTILMAERMWKKNRTGAVVMMTVINGAMAAVAMHNMHNAQVNLPRN